MARGVAMSTGCIAVSAREGRGKVLRHVDARLRLVAGMARLPRANYRLLLDGLFLMGTFTVAIQAFRSQEYVWAAGFLAITAVFNPFIPMIKAADNPPLTFAFVYAAIFLISLAALNMQAIPATSGPGRRLAMHRSARSSSPG